MPRRKKKFQDLPTSRQQGADLQQATPAFVTFSPERAAIIISTEQEPRFLFAGLNPDADLGDFRAPFSRVAEVVRASVENEKYKLIKEKPGKAQGGGAKCFASYGGRSSLPDASGKWRNLVSQPSQKHFVE
ncbi:hypothetical protein KM043_005394 [Ampulex compressa]|nr:hypothetical protein KM043_005394 [Ampulex compressa]